MRITIDASALSYPKRTGIGRCLEAILPYLATLAAGRDDYILVSGQPIVNPVALNLIAQGTLEAATANVPSLYAWQQTGMNRQFIPGADVEQGAKNPEAQKRGDKDIARKFAHSV